MTSPDNIPWIRFKIVNIKLLTVLSLWRFWRSSYLQSINRYFFNYCHISVEIPHRVTIWNTKLCFKSVTILQNSSYFQPFNRYYFNYSHISLEKVVIDISKTKTLQSNESELNGLLTWVDTRTSSSEKIELLISKIVIGHKEKQA